MKLIATLASFGLAIAANADVTIKATNKLPFERKSQTIELTSKELAGLEGKALNTIRVKDAAGKELLTQAVDTDFDARHRPDIVIFQSDFGPSESRTFTIFSGGKVVYKPADFKAHGRFVRERFDDFAWENDRIAHRTYGPGLITWEGEPLTSSTIDIWSKRTPRMVQDEWYMADDYHTDNGEGADFYSAGKSRGCGADGIWTGSELMCPINFVTSRVLANGPIRVMFELDYDPYDAGQLKMAQTRRISLDAGSQLDRIVITYKPGPGGGSGGAGPLTAGLGLKKVAGEEVHYNKDHGWLAKWEKVEKNQGMQGLAVLADPATSKHFADDKLNQLLLVTIPADKKLSYWAGFCWDKAGHLKTFDEWKKYVDEAAQGAASPIEVSVGR